MGDLACVSQAPQTAEDALASSHSQEAVLLQRSNLCHTREKSRRERDSDQMSPSYGGSTLEELMAEHTGSCYLGIEGNKGSRKNLPPVTWEASEGQSH